VNVYSQGARALKYGFLITLLCLSVLFLMETLGKTTIHPMQYFLVTMPLTCFYILLIAFAEHIGFSVAYAIASASVIGLIFIYFRGIGASRKQSFGLGGVLSGVYALIFTMLSSEDYALLIGAISLFLCLAAFMLLTRKLDWSKRLQAKSEPESVHA
jgi:inner membrane protein